MSNPRREIKSLSALFAFEAAGRLGSFTAAAKELGVTQAAVSKHIAALEAEIGAPLFTRHHREIRLTAKGQDLLRVTSSSLSAMAAALREIREPRIGEVVTIGATMTVAHFWLLPRLTTFRSEHPEVPIRIVSQEARISVADGDVDIAIRFGDGRWSDGRVQPLMESRIHVMASPVLVERHGPFESPSDVVRMPLISYDTVDETWTNWDEWALHAGLASVPAPALSFNRYWDALRAAVSDQGALLVWSGLTGGLEEGGALVRVPGPELIPRGDFYLVEGGGVRRSSFHSLIADWLVGQGGGTGRR